MKNWPVMFKKYLPILVRLFVIKAIFTAAILFTYQYGINVGFVKSSNMIGPPLMQCIGLLGK